MSSVAEQTSTLEDLERILNASIEEQQIAAEKDELKTGLQWGDIIYGKNPTTGRTEEQGKHYPVHQYQKDILDSPARFTAAIAGTGGGKTAVGPLWISEKIDAMRAKGHKKPIMGLVVAPTYKVLSRATVPTLVDTFKGTHLEGRYLESRSFYELPKYNGEDGGKIWCQGADNPGGIEGGQFDFCWGDEAGQFKKMVWTAIQGRLGAKEAPCLLTTTPYIKNWLFTDFYKQFTLGDPDYYVRQWSSIENPIYSKREYDRAKRTMNKSLAAMRYDGIFSTLSGAVYPNIADALVTIDDKEAFDRLVYGPGTYYGGIDFGWNDPFCALAGKVDLDDVLWIWYERYLSKTPIEKHAAKLPKFPGKGLKWFCEHEPELVSKLRKGGHTCVKATKAILPGIEAVNARILSGRLKIIENACRATVNEGQLYSFPEDEEKSGGDKPIGGFDHAMDALRYMVFGIDGRRAA